MLLPYIFYLKCKVTDFMLIIFPFYHLFFKYRTKILSLLSPLNIAPIPIPQGPLDSRLSTLNYFSSNISG